MTWTRRSWVQGTWAAGNVAQAQQGGVGATDPTQGAVTWRWVPVSGVSPWARSGWAGGGLVGPPAGGVLVTPDDASGTVRGRVWWASERYVRIMRIAPDGSRTPVRGAYPITVTTPTRSNIATNPSAANNTTGWSASTGSPTLSRLTGLTSPAPLSTAVRMTATAAGTSSAYLPVTLPGSMTARIGFAVRYSKLPSALRLTADFTDDSGLALPQVAVTVPVASLPAVGTWGRGIVDMAPPTGSRSKNGQLRINADGLAAGDTVDVTALSIEDASLSNATGQYFDGNTLGAYWAGSAGNSLSVLAPIVSFVDGEAPLDVPVVYEVTPSSATMRAISNSVTLDSNDVIWVTHPADPTTAVEVEVEKAPQLSRDIDQSAFTVIGRANPVVVTGSRRRAPTGTLTVCAPSFGDRDRLLAMLADGQPLYLRAPARLGYGYGWWIAIGNVTESTTGTYGGSGLRHLELPFTVVDAPVTPNAQLVA